MGQKMGIWIEYPGNYTGWFGLACGETLTPWKFGPDEIAMRLENVKKSMPEAKLIEARVAPDSIPWGVKQWEDSKL